MNKCKDYALLRDVVCEYHPVYSSNEMKNIVLENPNHFNVPRLIEETMAIVGGYEFVDGAHYDFSDGTECKTASVGINPSDKRYPNGYRATISNMSSGAGVNKTGDTRVVMYNHLTDSVHFLYIPKDHVGRELHITRNSSSNIGRIEATFNSKKSEFCKKIKPYFVDSFEVLAQRKPKADPVKKLIFNLDKYSKRFDFTLEKALQI